MPDTMPDEIIAFENERWLSSFCMYDTRGMVCAAYVKKELSGQERPKMISDILSQTIQYIEKQKSGPAYANTEIQAKIDTTLLAMRDLLEILDYCPASSPHIQ